MPIANEPVAAWATDCRDKYPENHDSGYAGRICMADGNLAWAAVVSDGAGGSIEGLKVSALAVQAFVEAVRKSNLAELSDPGARDAWLRGWTKALHADVAARFRGGMATFCGAVILPPPSAGSGADWKLFTLNVGDSQVLKLDGSGRCMGVTPDAPPNNANVEGHNPVRVVGVAPKGDFCLIDTEEFPLPAEGPCWILAGSDGFFSKKKGKDELSIFASADLRDVCIGSGAPFQDLPALAIRRSLANAQKLGAAEMMDNSTVAMLGFRVPATDLVAPAVATAPQASQGAAVKSNAGEAGRRAAQAAPAAASGVTRTKAANVCGTGKPLAAVAAGALVLGLVLGFALSGKSAAAPDSVSQGAAVAPALDERSLPSNGRCRKCLTALADPSDRRVTKPEQTFHWEDAPTCPLRDSETLPGKR